jgi:hypothetical protein
MPKIIKVSYVVQLYSYTQVYIFSGVGIVTDEGH